MSEKLIDIIVGARPNFIKIAAIIRVLESRKLYNLGLRYRLIHTSQHYDERMSGVFFEELNIPAPNINLNVGIEENINQIATIITRYTNVLMEKKPDMVIVSGDVNSTVACALATKKTDPSIPLVHIEAGLRCSDKQMPEEINRILTDSISDYYFTTSVTASNNLLNEGVHPNQIFFVGNTMIDTLYNNEKRFKRPAIWDIIGLESKGYYVLTLHRKGNISDHYTLSSLLESIADVVGNTPIIFPMHPHTEKMIQSYGIKLSEQFVITEPLGYLEFNYLVKNAIAVITDSGGISEEATIMNIPCMTLRDNTERPETCEIGTNRLIGNNPLEMQLAFESLKSGNWPLGKSPELWDGKAAERIIDVLISIIENPVLKNKNFDILKSRDLGNIGLKTIFLN